MTLRTFGAVGAVLVAMAPGAARAQSESLKDTAIKMLPKVGVHVNMSSRTPVDPDVRKGTTFGVSIGLSSGLTNGWTYPFGLATFSEDLHSPNGERFAVMKSTAILAGIGYSWYAGRLSTVASLQTGFAFNRGKTEGDVLRAFAVPSGTVSLQVDNSPIVRPQVEAEYFITRKFTLRASAAYLMTRPGIAVTTPLERIVDRWNASNIHANIGIGFYPLRK
jgi:hypothetical protein